MEVPKKTKFNKNKNPRFKAKPKKSDRELNEIKQLDERCKKIYSKDVKKFKDLPLSSDTQKGLAEAGYELPTEIQRESVLLALRGLDVLGAAKTGSGKTLAFIIPLLERLYANRWSRLDGLGALVITPTRELAYQIFETLRKVGKYHDFSAGLVIGGKDLKFERKRMSTCNIVICTPGRLLQHMDENPEFDGTNLKILILDEADRCLDMGFSATMNAILENLPTEERQTLLFSATQTRSVKDLARLSLKNPLYVSVHENATFSTPDNLAQNYLVCDLDQKMNVLWSFIKSHKKKKVLVFMQSCKQVKYASDLFRRLRCPVTILALYGTLHQLRRMAIYDEFVQGSQVVMFATDIAARGLDFPSVDWVVQLDCPEDATTYLHRVGRTARLAAVGQGLLVLTPEEEPGMLQQLRAHKIPIDKIEADPKKLTDIQRKIEAHLASDVELKECAQRAFHSYLKSIYLMKNKAVFDVFKIDTTKFATSLGLAVQPRVRFLQNQLKRREAVSTKPKADDEGQHEAQDDFHQPEGEKFEKLALGAEDDSDDDDMLTVKRADHDIPDEPNGMSNEDESLEISLKSKSKVVTKAALAKKVMKKKIQANQVIRFDEEGSTVIESVAQKCSEEGRRYDNDEAEAPGINIEKAKLVLKAEDKFDRQMEREKIRKRKKEEKRKAKEAKKRKAEESEGFDGSSDEDDRPNLDWLPDPDKIYGKSDDQSGSSDDEEATSSKWKPPKKPKSNKTKWLSSIHQPELPVEKEQLSIDESLALQLLRQK